MYIYAIIHQKTQKILALCKDFCIIGADEGTRTHMVSHRNLKPARLPVSPHPHFFCLSTLVIITYPLFLVKRFFCYLLKIFKIKVELYRSPLSFCTAFIRLQFSLRYIHPKPLSAALSNLLRHTKRLRDPNASLPCTR